MSVWAAIKGIATGADFAKGIRDGLDALHFSDEEKVQATVEGSKLFLEYMKLNADQNSLRSKARRHLAKVIVYFNLATVPIAVIAYLWKGTEVYKSIVDTVVAFKIPWAFVSVVTFYFFYYGMTNIVEKAKGK